MPDKSDSFSNQPIPQLIGTRRPAIRHDLEPLQQPHALLRLAEELQDVRNDVEPVRLGCVLERARDVARREREFGREEGEKLATVDGAVEA
jgi:hypothetical protein